MKSTQSASKRVLSVRLKDSVVKKIDQLIHERKFESRTHFIKSALDFYISKKLNEERTVNGS
ncbi:ribbon-helix-helix domain-containing protein [Sulfodiicoccus acidiphilus]|uniref:ribbon-helix-helix domain-containing protein n=1 Tax=Sulfodiicoccus acidiphilus TaxID=1670455 RepID=UPI000F84575B|nr:ribbon-helix-helix domain-containing protein [Sulfodiicoccus acidiphilus]